MEQARGKQLLSEEHFSADGMLLQAWESVKIFRPKDGEPPSGDGGHKPGGNMGCNPEVDFHGERSSNATHESTSALESRLVSKDKEREPRLCFEANVLMANREGLIVDVSLTPADGTWERDTTIEVMSRTAGRRRITVGADREYDTTHFAGQCRQLRVTLHVAHKKRSAIDDTRHESYRWTQRERKRIEEVFGWVKILAGGRKLHYCGLARNRMWTELTVAGYNLVRLVSAAA